MKLFHLTPNRAKAVKALGFASALVAAATAYAQTGSWDLALGVVLSSVVSGNVIGERP